MPYATLQDVYRLGLSAQAFVTRPRALDKAAGDALDFAHGIFRLIAHGLAADDSVQLVLVGAGAVPTGAVANTPYSPGPLDFYRFQLALPGQAPLTFTDAGSGAWAIQVDPEARLLAHLKQTAAELDQDLTAQSPPLLVDPTTGAYPQVIVGMNARMTARCAVTSLQIENAAFKVAVDRLFEQEKRDDEQRASWRNGQPILPQATDQKNVAADAPRAISTPRARGRRPVPWKTGYL